MPNRYLLSWHSNLDPCTYLLITFVWIACHEYVWLCTSVVVSCFVLSVLSRVCVNGKILSADLTTLSSGTIPAHISIVNIYEAMNNRCNILIAYWLPYSYYYVNFRLFAGFFPSRFLPIYIFPSDWTIADAQVR